MKAIVLTKENTTLLPSGVYKWTPPSGREPYNLTLESISINTNGGIYTGGEDIDTNGGYIHTNGGCINTNGGYISTNGGDIYTSGGHINTNGGYISTNGGDIDTNGGDISTSGGHITCGKLYWRCMQMPKTQGGKIRVTCIFPDAVTRPHWVSRLADIVGISQGCYNDIFTAIAPHMDEILASDRWSECERWILESIANYIRKTT